MDKIIHITNTCKNIEDIAVSVVIRSVILSFNVLKLYIAVQGPELQCLLKVKKDLSNSGPMSSYSGNSCPSPTLASF